jgi:hypothetical protein
MQRRRKRDFFLHGIDNSIEFHFAHRRAPLRRADILSPGR